ncbi:FtsX-like permease family protein [Spiroplasma endosymbiont of 'Nebria riversi']|uniref:FtsX-like permease family protein n=1 Tax=Spiroplasma endosymbiont of 'Nebria riversi' TaxID=2792084 RepID=UPI001C0447AC|nr:FtsX-like permease family protein [Spiroplasma endosymbiont of 'Nebria riversi']
MFVFVTSTVVNDSINKSFSPINYHYNYFYDSSFLLQNDKKSFKYPFVKVEEINIKKTKLGLFDLLMLYGNNKLQLEIIFKDYYLPAPLLDLMYSQLNGFISKIENSPVSEHEAIYNKLTMAINNLFSFKETVSVQQTQMVIENWFILWELVDLSKTNKTDAEGNVRKVITTNIGFDFVPYQEATNMVTHQLLDKAISNNNKALGSLMVHSVDFEHHKAFLKLENENENNLYPLLEQELVNWNEAKDINEPIPLVINSVMATLYDLTVVDYFVIEFKYNDNIQKVNFKIVGIADFYQNSYVYAPLDAMRFVFGLDNNSYNAKYSQQDSLEVQDWITLRTTDGNNNLQGLKPLLNSLLDMSAVKQIALKYNNIIAIIIAIIIFFATTISVVILIMITNIVITENKKRVIVFQTLGYKIHEVSNIIMSAYIPTIIIAFLVGVPISIIILK